MKEKVAVYRLVDGKIYKLADAFTNPKDAVELAKKLRDENHVFVTKTRDGLWATYWRARTKDIDCTLKIS
jgi:hypothetical protein